MELFKRNNILFFLILIISFYFTKSDGIFDYSHLEESHLFIQAGPLSSKKSIIPLDYNKVGICESNKIIKAEDTLGEILTGQTLYTTGHIAHTNINKYCEILCNNDFGDTTTIKNLIKRKYFANYYLDKLPAGLMTSKESKIIKYNR